MQTDEKHTSNKRCSRSLSTISLILLATTVTLRSSINGYLFGCGIVIVIGGGVGVGIIGPGTGGLEIICGAAINVRA
jgi:hypothetical protein